MHRRFLSEAAPPWPAMAIATAALLSLVSLIDAVPDLIPLVDRTDAVSVIALAFAKLTTDLKQYRPS